MPTAFASHELFALALVVLLLGVKHGLDADHLAAIDGITRSNAPRRPRLARSSGLLFSLGHGVVVVGVALATSAWASAWQVPAWLDRVGAWVSIAVLTALAVVNIQGVLATPPGEQPVPIGWRAGVFARLLTAGSAPAVMGVGALFALSFDTLSQATLFAVTSARFGGVPAAALLAGVFVAGMLAIDGVNGWWIAGLVRRSDRTARVASRTMGLSVAGIGLLTAALGVAVQTSDAAAAWANGMGAWLGLGAIVVVAASFAIAMRLAQGSPHGLPVSASATHRRA